MSTYLISKAKHYRNFRLLFEMRMPVGNHSGVGFWGQQHRFEQEESTWKGHLAILPQTGIFDIYNRGWNERVKREGTTFGVSGDWLCKGPGTSGEGPKVRRRKAIFSSAAVAVAPTPRSAYSSGRRAPLGLLPPLLR